MLQHFRPLMIMAACVVAFASSAGADEHAEDVIKYREALMKSLGGHIVAISQIVSGRVNPEGHLRVHAVAIAGLTGDLTEFFPEGSYDEESEAKPEIWEDWAGFEAAADKNRKATRAFLKSVESGAEGADLAASFKQLGGSCKGCHEDFRRKD